MSIPKGSIKAVSLDYGHVLGGLDLNELSRRLQKASALYRISVPLDSYVLLERAQVVAYQHYDEAVAQGFDHQHAWYALMKQFVAAVFYAVTDQSVIVRIVDDLWKAQPTQNLWRYIPTEAIQLLDALSKARIPMVVTSNSEGRAAELLEQLGVRKYFHAIVDSGVVHVAKPDVRIFQMAADHLGVPLHQIVHVGDSEQADIVGAQNAGAWAIRFDAFVPARNQQPSQAHAIANNYKELSALLFNAFDIRS